MLLRALSVSVLALASISTSVAQEPGRGSAARAVADRPNVLILMADDWSWPHAGAYGAPVVETPTFDRIAAEGVVFSHAFVASPSCTPARHAFVTGQHPWRLEGGANLWGSLPAEIPTFPDLLAAAGYHVGYSGKGCGPTNNILRERNGGGERYRNYREFLDQRPDGSPFCFWASTGDPHRPYEKGVGVRSGMDPSEVVVPKCLPDCAEIRSDLCDYLWEVQRFDRWAARLVAMVEADGGLDDTVVVMTGDNGMPFPGCKATLYDGGTRVPLAIRWPRVVRAGRRVDDLVGLGDLAPTLLEAAGVTVPEAMTSRSLMPLLRSEGSGVLDEARSYVLTGLERHCFSNPARALRTRDHLLIWNAYEGAWPTGGGEYSHNIDPSPSKTWMIEHRAEDGVRGPYARAFGSRPEFELYDLRADPQQMVDIAGTEAHAGIERELRERLMDALEASDDPRDRGEGASFERYPWR